MTAGFADEPGVLQALTDHTDNADQEPARVSVLALVESERLLVEIAEQVKRLDADIGSANRSLEQAPEILKPVGVHVVSDVANGMVDLLVREL